MNEERAQVADEIATLETRATQLEQTSSGCRIRLTSLFAESAAARSAEDAVATQKIGRKIHLEEQRAGQIASELKTLLELIAARRSRYGIEASPRPAEVRIEPR